MIEIKKIGAIETYSLRQPVLRSGKPVDSCHFEGDNFETTCHFGYFEDVHLLGVISLFESKNLTFPEQNQFQIRGMAVLSNQQKKGIGKKLMRHTEDFVAQRKDPFIWFNARENAVGFYKKLGYVVLGNPFDIEDVGTHYIMCKRLN
jgi:GNAT superfamily N-acetyltransferase